MEGLTEGRMVHYVLPDGSSSGEHRPAVVVKVWRHTDENGIQVPPANGCCNLQVFIDGTNDFQSFTQPIINVPIWRASVLYSEATAPGTWHWIEKA